MTKPTIRIHNVETNSVIDREMTDEEFAQWQLDQDRAAAQVVAQAEKEANRQALLTKLGITDDEARLLLS
jgi:hypothetical protein